MAGFPFLFIFTAPASLPLTAAILDPSVCRVNRGNETEGKENRRRFSATDILRHFVSNPREKVSGHHRALFDVYDLKS